MAHRVGVVLRLSLSVLVAGVCGKRARLIPVMTHMVRPAQIVSTRSHAPLRVQGTRSTSTAAVPMNASSVFARDSHVNMWPAVSPSRGMLHAGGVQGWFDSQGIDVIRGGGGGGGGGWSSTSIWKTSQGEFFVKTASRPAKDMFEGEALGLRALGAAGGVKVPEVFQYGDDGRGGSFIIMEKIDLGGGLDMRDFGRAMAMMHMAEPQDPNAKKGLFGFAVDNTIGGTPQKNPWTDDWPTFFREHRIGYQVKRARRQQLTSLWQEVIKKTDGLKSLFTDGPISPSVLHGDLWSGNYAGSPGGAAIYDPAVYYGHHEAEWGMAWCAGFGSSFWEGYREIIPEAPLFQERYKLYTAYHKLNHYNLFGGGYLSQAESLLRQLT